MSINYVKTKLEKIGKFERIVLILLALVITLPITFFIFMLYIDRDSKIFGGEEFNQSIWAARQNRCKMTLDLKNNHLNLVVSKQDVIFLLGEAEYLFDSHCIEYQLGTCGTLSFDPEGLVICFDKSEKIESVWIHLH